MRAALWLIGLFALAVAGAWLADHNEGVVAIFLHPYRIDLSLNLFALGLLLLVAVLLLAQKAVSALVSLPREARRWRLQQKERAAHAALLDAYGQFMAGRYLRARKAAELVLAREDALRDVADHPLAHSAALRTVAHVLAAESAHALQDKALRDQHLQQAEQEAGSADAGERQALGEGLNLREATGDPTAHAEVLAIRAAAQALGRERLDGCDLWVTLEPCAMCAGAIGHARIDRVYYAAPDPKGGAVEHGGRLFDQPGCLHRPEIYSGMGEAEAAELLRSFFRDRRG